MQRVRDDTVGQIRSRWFFPLTGNRVAEADTGG
jgi:hypothetical protein